MTTSPLDPLLVPPPAPAALAPPRETPAGERPFRDLLRPERSANSEAPPDKPAPPAQPAAAAPPPADAPVGKHEVKKGEKAEGEEPAKEEQDVAAAVATACVVLEQPREEAKVAEEVVDAAVEAQPIAEEQPLPASPLPTDSAEELPPTLPQPKTAKGEVVACDKGLNVEAGDVAEQATGEEEEATNLPLPTAEVEAENVPPTAQETTVVAVAEPAEALPVEVEEDLPETDENTSHEEAASPTLPPDHKRSETSERSPAPPVKTAAEKQPEAPQPTTVAAAAAPAATRTEEPERKEEKRETKGTDEGAAQRTTSVASDSPVAQAEQPAAPLKNSPVATDAPADAAAAKPVETAAPRSDVSQPSAPPPTATASTERLGAMLAKSRVKTTGTGHGQPLTENQQARLVQRVAKAFDTARARGEAEIRLRLSPPSLGSLRLEVRMESGVMTARMEVETVAAQQALAENLGTLRQRLAEQNIRVEQFDIDLMDRHPGDSPDSQQSQFARDERPTGQRSGARSREGQRFSSAAEAARGPAAISASSNSSLDVLI